MNKTGFTIVIDGVEKYLKDFNSLNEAYKENLKQLKGLEVGTEEYYKQQKVVAELKNGIDDFKEALKEQSTLLEELPKNSLDDLNRAYKTQLKLLRELEIGSDEYNNQLEVVGYLKNEIKDFNKSIREQARGFEHLNKGVDAYKELEAETRRLKNESKNLAAQILALEDAGDDNSDTYKELAAQYEKTTKKAQELDKKLKEIDTTVGDGFRNVGNYKEGFEAALDESGDNVGSFKDAVVLAMEGGADGVDTLGDAFDLLSKNPLMLVALLLQKAFQKLVEAFKQSEEGSKIMNKVSQISSAIFSTLVSIVNDIVKGFISLAGKAGQLGQKISSAFSSPAETIKKLKDLIKENIQNRFEALLELIPELAGSLGLLLQGKFGQAAKKAGDAVLKLATGVENATDKVGAAAKAVAEKASDAMEKVNDKFNENLKLQKELDKIDSEAASSRAKLTKSLNELSGAYELATQRAGDSTLSLKQQMAANKEAMGLQEKLGQKKIEAAQTELETVRKRIKARGAEGKSAADLIDAETEALTALREAELEKTIILRENASERRQIRLDEAEQTLDILIDGFDRQKSINEQLIGDDELSFQKRQKLLDETKENARKSFDEQSRIIQGFTKKQIDFNTLLTQQNAVKLNQQIQELGLNETMTARLLEMINERKQIEIDFAETQKELNEGREADRLAELELEKDIAEQLIEIKYAKGLISEAEYNEKILEAELDRMKTSLDQAEEDSKEREILENEIALKKIELEKATDEKILENKKAVVKKELDLIDKKAEEEKDLIDAQFLRGEISQDAHEKAVQDIEDEAYQKKLEFIKERGTEALDEAQEILDEEVERVKEKNQKILDDEQKKEDELERKRGERLKKVEEMTATLKGFSDALFENQLQNAEGNEAELEKIQRRQFQVNKAFSAVDAIINTAKAVMATYGEYGSTPFGIAMAAVQAATGAIQVSTILSQAPPMASGGFTGRGFMTDETGQRTTGLYRLHEGEYVAPRSQVSANPSLFSALENNRATGAALKTPTQKRGNDTQLLTAISQMTRNIKVVADPDEILKFGADKNQIKKSKNL